MMGANGSGVTRLFTSESVSEGHPDKVCDFIADSVLDAFLKGDRNSRVACEVLCKSNHIIVAGEITSAAHVDVERVVQGAIRTLGYDDPAEPFHADGVFVSLLLTRQSPEIARGVDADAGSGREQGAGDQGLMFGYATDETPERMPLPILLAHRITRRLAEDRRRGAVAWLRPDAKAQVTVQYEGVEPVRVTNVLVSTQHSPDVGQPEILAYVREKLLPEMLGERWWDGQVAVLVNPTGSFVQGGPAADCGVTGRKIVVDTYGGMARHGGGAFSGKDPSKVDRSGAYFCRLVARGLIEAKLARRAEVQVAYAIGRADPVSLRVETFDTGDETAAEAYTRRFDFRPAQVIERLSLLNVRYLQTTNYGHFGRPGLPWEDLPPDQCLTSPQGAGC
jgi:S-adenosylmethionine synthetase